MKTRVGPPKQQTGKKTMLSLKKPGSGDGELLPHLGVFVGDGGRRRTEWGTREEGEGTCHGRRLDVLGEWKSSENSRMEWPYE